MTGLAGNAHPLDSRLHGDRGRFAPIVVGVDDAGSVVPAIEWAAAEAATSNRPLRLVHAWCFSTAIGPYGFTAYVDAGYRKVVAEDILADAAQRACSVAPEIEIQLRPIMGLACDVLREQAAVAHLLVLGGKRRRRGGGQWSCTVGSRMMRKAGCPVVVIHPHSDVPPGPSAVRVVVGVDADAPSDRILRYAFEAAAQRGVAVTAVYALDDRRTTSAARLDHVLLEFTKAFPGVPFETKVVHAPVASALVDESAGAALTVLGARSRRRISVILDGSISRSVIRCAHSPVAVVGPRC